jgi:hypothetical protein
MTGPVVVAAADLDSISSSGMPMHAQDKRPQLLYRLTMIGRSLSLCQIRFMVGDVSPSSSAWEYR